MMQHAVGFVLIPVSNATDAICSLSLVTNRQGGCRSQLLATSREAPNEPFELQFADDCAEELLQKAGRVIHDQKLPYELRLLSAAAPAAADPANSAAAAAAAGPDASQPAATTAAAATAAPTATPPAAAGVGAVDAPQTAAAAAAAAPLSYCIQLIIGLQNMLLQGVGWRASSAAALLFKQLLPMDADVGTALQQALQCPTAVTQQQQQGCSDSSGPDPGRYTLVSCFRELPSVSTAPPPTAISMAGDITQQQQQQQQQQQHDHRIHHESDHQPNQHKSHPRQQQQQGITNHTSNPELRPTTARSEGPSGSGSSSSSSSLGDVPAEVMQQLLGLLGSRDLASLACCCKGLRSVTWEAVPGLKLILYPHQRNALSWMLHREVHGGLVMPHPYIVEYVTDTGVPVYVHQVTGDLSADPPPCTYDIRGGFFCDEPGLGKTVTALSLILKTQGTTPSPPLGSHVTWLKTPDGRKVGYYTLGRPDQAVSLDSSAVQHVQQSDLAAAAVVQGILANLGRSGGPRRSGSYAGTGSNSGLAGCFNRRTSSSGVMRRQGAWALAPSLRSSSSRRRARSEAAAADVAAAAAAAAAAEREIVKAFDGSSSSRKQKLPPQSPVPIPNKQQQQDETAQQSGAAAASAPASTAASPQAAEQQTQQDKTALAGTTNNSPHELLQEAFSLGKRSVQSPGPAAAAAAAGISSDLGTAAAVQLWLPRRKAAVKAVNNIQQIYTTADQASDDSDSRDHHAAAAAAAAGSSRAGSHVRSRLASSSRVSHDGSVRSDDSADVSGGDEPTSDESYDSGSESDYRTGRKQNLKKKLSNNSTRSRAQRGSKQPDDKQQQQQQQQQQVHGDVASQPPAKRRKLQQRQQQAAAVDAWKDGAASPRPQLLPEHEQLQQGEEGRCARDSEGSPAASASEGDAGSWVMCDHCSKWRTLPPGHEVDSDTPWFCCLHPDPDLASCLIPEEQHDGNNTSHNIDTDGCMKYSYRSMPGFIPADHELSSTAAAAASEANSAHFTAVINQVADCGDPGWVQQFLWWLAGQSPELLVTEGVTIPREVVKGLPEYGRILSLMSLQPKAAAAAAKKKAGSSSSSSKRAKPAANPPTPVTAAATAAGGSQASQQQQQQDTNQAVMPGSRKSPAPRAPAAAAAAADPRFQDTSDHDYDPASDSAAATTPAAAAAGSSRKRPSSSSSGRYNAAAHTWIQPPACEALRFDVAALRTALDQGSGEAAATPRMYLSSATLVIVPVTLIPHWQQQIRQHLLPRRLRVIVLGSATALAAGTDPGAAAAGSRGGSSSSRKASSSTAAGGGGAAETVCPPAHELAWNYDVVITTFNRLSSDWSMRGDPRLAERIVMLKVHWLRVLIDEGHSLGASLGLTNKLAMAVQLTAQRRWVMTGTPTPATAAGSGAAHLHPLLSFLHHQPYGTSRTAWDGAVAKPLEAAAGGSSGGRGLGPGASVLVAEWGRRQLLKLLGRVMIRSCKSDLALLPPCYKKVTLLDFGSDHAHSYNALIEVIRRNLLLADWCDDAHKESLLNPKQSRWAKEMLSNVRLACCVAGVMNLVPKEEDVLETLELLAGKLELPKPASEQHFVPAAAAAAVAAGPQEADQLEAQPGSSRSAQLAGEQQQQQEVAAAGDVLLGVVLRQIGFFTGPGHPLHGVEDGLRNGCKCQVCGDMTHLPMVTPCAHMLCTDCAAVSRTACPVPSCRHPYRMQAVNDDARYKNNPEPKWEVPLDLIEWQPVYHQIGATGLSGGQWSANWQITRSTKVLHLIRRLAEIGIYAPHGSHTAATAGSSSSIAAAAAGSTRSYLNSTIQPAAAASEQPPVVKAIVFSQFWMHILLVAAELAARGVPHVFLKRDMPARDKQAAVTAFRASNKSSCLVMDESGALGLDLSFVRYIFLMEPIADAALEQQVVSRAHRMGATAAVQVEVLAMRHTAEEHLVALRHQAASGKLNSAAVNEAASHAAAAVAGTARGAQQQQPDQQQQEEEIEELGGSSAAAAAVDLTNISNFISVGGGGNQMDSRGLRNLLLLHLRKVVVADLPDLPDHFADSAAAGLDDLSGQQIGWRGGRGNLLQFEGNASRAAAAAAVAAAPAGGDGAAGSAVEGAGSSAAAAATGGGGGSMWGDFAVRQRQRSEPLDIGEEYDDSPDQQQQQQQVAQAVAANSNHQGVSVVGATLSQVQASQQQQQHQQDEGPRVQFARLQDGPTADEHATTGAQVTEGGAVQQSAAGASNISQQAAAAAQRPKPVKRARFADDA